MTVAALTITVIHTVVAGMTMDIRMEITMDTRTAVAAVV